MPHIILTSPGGPIRVRWEQGAVTGVDLIDPTAFTDDRKGDASAVAINHLPQGGLDALTARETDSLAEGVEPLSQEALEALVAGEFDGFAERIRRQFTAYLASPTAGFSLPLRLRGTAHQQRVWQALREIPCGETRTYGELAVLLRSGPRAVGQACRTNPCPILVPCHRVVARDGLGGYTGQRHGPRLAMKHWLLTHEGAAREREPDHGITLGG